MRNADAELEPSTKDTRAKVLCLLCLAEVEREHVALVRSGLVSVGFPHAHERALASECCAAVLFCGGSGLASYLGWWVGERARASDLVGGFGVGWCFDCHALFDCHAAG